MIKTYRMRQLRAGQLTSMLCRAMDYCDANVPIETEDRYEDFEDTSTGIVGCYVPEDKSKIILVRDNSEKFGEYAEVIGTPKQNYGVVKSIIRSHVFERDVWKLTKSGSLLGTYDFTIMALPYPGKIFHLGGKCTIFENNEYRTEAIAPCGA